ncbi:hypothetical protein W04_3583 [Pseudoalteromonas sp. SW0106-04]|nr:hypothetical protein [Pseudoalteromonas sp. SW0106-04]GAP77004.1 hypothetical protein W04_3583 [Pseudoalteromonas sp. SW0106-04]
MAMTIILFEPTVIYLPGEGIGMEKELLLYLKVASLAGYLNQAKQKVAI